MWGAEKKGERTTSDGKSGMALFEGKRSVLDIGDSVNERLEGCAAPAQDASVSEEGGSFFIYCACKISTRPHLW